MFSRERGFPAGARGGYVRAPGVLPASRARRPPLPPGDGAEGLAGGAGGEALQPAAAVQREQENDPLGVV